MRLMIPMIAAMTLVAGGAHAARTLSYNQQAYANTQLSRNPPVGPISGSLPGQDLIARKLLAEQAVRLINSGDCVGARRMVARRGDHDMLMRVDEVCGAPVPASPTTE